MNLADLIVNFKQQHTLIFSLIVIAMVIIIAMLLQVISSYLIAKLSRHFKTNNTALPTGAFKVPILLLSIIFGMSVATPFIQLPYRLEKIVQQSLSIAGIIAVTWLLINFIAIIRHVILQKYDLKAADNFEARKVYTQLKIISRIINTFIIILAIAAICMTFDSIQRVGYSLLASAGISAAIFGLAAQRSFGSIFAGLQVALTQPIRIDDVVIVENEWGVIEEINLSYVVMRIWDKRRLVIPITYFLEKPFQNWSRQSTDLIGSIFIYTDYTVPVDELRAELQKILQDHPLWDKQASVIHVTEAKPEVLELRVLVSASNAGKLFDLRCDVREKLVNYLQVNYPHSLPRARVELPTEQFSPLKEESVHA
jgi:small-conductance mechanosensitive channel